MVLAGKLGLYSILRFSFGIFPDQSRRIAPLLIALGAIGIVYGALLALVQKDLKKLAAYGTLGHVSVVVLGIFTFTIAGLDGGIYQTLNEGIGGAALFILLGVLYERYGTYDMREYGGLAAKLPWMVTLFVITTLSVIGLPMLNGFVGEFLVFSGSMQVYGHHHAFWTALATSGVILTAAYMLSMIQKVFYGNLGLKSRAVTAPDLNAREHLALWPLVAVMLAMGLASPYWMHAIDPAGTSLATGRPAEVQPPNPCCAMPIPPVSDSDSPVTPARRPALMLSLSPNIIGLLPEYILTLTGILIMLAEPCLKPTSSRKSLGWIAILGTLLAGAASGYQTLYASDHALHAFSDTIQVDTFSIFFHLLIAAVVLVTLLGSLDYFEDNASHAGEYFALVLFGAIGMMLMTCSVELLMVFIGLEISSISTYIMAGMRKGQSTASESSIKYFLLGSFATAFFLYGVALAFGATGSTSIAAIATSLGTTTTPPSPSPPSP